LKIGHIKHKNVIERFEKEPLTFCLCIQYIIALIRLTVSQICWNIVRSTLFEIFILFTILANCVFLTMDDPTTDYQAEWLVYTNYAFQAIYTAELVLKVFALGFVFNKGAYLRDFWNILDFIIVLFGFFEYFNINSSGFDMKVLRLFRVLRPLRTVTSIEGLKILLTALFSSIPILFDAVIVEVFFLAICAIAALQLWHGSLTKRCKSIETGFFVHHNVCGSRACPNGYTCEEYGENPNFGSTSYDNFFYALLTVFTSVTQEGWADVQRDLIGAYGYLSTIFFAILIIVGSYFVFNFTLAVIKTKVSKIYKKIRAAQRIAKQVSLSRNINQNELTKIMLTTRNRQIQFAPQKSIFFFI